MPADVPAAWGLIGSVPRLAACIPGIGDVEEIEPATRYRAVVTDKLGPFTLRLPVQFTIDTRQEPSRLVAAIAGDDGRGQARVSGRVEAALAESGQGTILRVQARIDVLGKMAALGATPMRRRADAIFDEFMRRVAAELAG